MEKGLVHVLRADLARRRKATWKQMKKSKISFSQSQAAPLDTTSC